jgi:hypothetical protein
LLKILKNSVASTGRWVDIANDLQYAKPQSDRLTTARAVAGDIARRGLALWLALQILLIAAMAASPALHRAIHHDADNDDHDCVVTVFINGAVDTATTVLAVAVFVAFVVAVTFLGEHFVFAPANYRFSSSRAPPLAFFCR